MTRIATTMGNEFAGSAAAFRVTSKVVPWQRFDGAQRLPPLGAVRCARGPAIRSVVTGTRVIRCPPDHRASTTDEFSALFPAQRRAVFAITEMCPLWRMSRRSTATRRAGSARFRETPDRVIRPPPNRDIPNVTTRSPAHAVLRSPNGSAKPAVDDLVAHVALPRGRPWARFAGRCRRLDSAEPAAGRRPPHGGVVIALG